MKSIYKILIALGIILSAGWTYSCNMDKEDKSAIPSKVTRISDMNGLITMQYYYLQDLYLNEYSLHGEYMTDLFQPSKDYGNFYGTFVRWEITPGVSEINAYWYWMYRLINEANLLIDGIDTFSKEDRTESELNRINEYYGIAHFFRAHHYFELAKRYCKPYNASTENEEYSGLLIVTKPFHPATDLLSRSTLKQVKDLILEDLRIAEEYVKVAGAANSYYVTEDVIKALKARVSLEMGDYATAAAEAVSLISNGKYALTIDREAFEGMWALDDDVPGLAWNDVTYTAPQQELIMVLNVVDPADANTDNHTPGRYFNSYLQQKGFRPQFFPTKKSVDMYERASDIRFNAYFTQRNYDMPDFDDDNIYFFTKYPGNRNLQLATDQYSYYTHKGKPFRIAEQYLIAAEAYYYEGDEGNANKYLNELRSNRIEGWMETTYSRDGLLAEIKLERNRELYGEGFRYFDLKRWGDGVERGEVQSDILVNDGDKLKEINIIPGDYRFTWPIPKDEVDVNQQLKDQQNDGY